MSASRNQRALRAAEGQLAEIHQLLGVPAVAPRKAPPAPPATDPNDAAGTLVLKPEAIRDIAPDVLDADGRLRNGYTPTVACGHARTASSARRGCTPVPATVPAISSRSGSGRCGHDR
jgi:hypothetical protein